MHPSSRRRSGKRRKEAEAQSKKTGSKNKQNKQIKDLRPIFKCWIKGGQRKDGGEKASSLEQPNSVNARSSFASKVLLTKCKTLKKGLMPITDLIDMVKKLFSKSILRETNHDGVPGEITKLDSRSQEKTQTRHSIPPPYDEISNKTTFWLHWPRLNPLSIGHDSNHLLCFLLCDLWWNNWLYLT